jgi:hypothetical protein
VLRALTPFIVLFASAISSTVCAGIPIRFRNNRECCVTVVIEDAEGNRVRNLVAETRLPAGENTVWWDGYDDGEWDRDHNLVRHRVRPGTYRVRGLAHDGIRMRYEFSVYSPGTPPWKTRDGSGGWLADHSPPADVLFLPDGGQGDCAMMGNLA